MKIDLTQKEFKGLLKLACLGSHLAYGVHAARHTDVARAQQAVLAHAEAFGCGSLARWCANCKEWHPSEELVEGGELARIIDAYDEEIFWEELACRLAERDFIRAYAEEQIEAMSLPQQEEREESLRGKWDEEFRSYGLERIEAARADEFEE